MDDPVTGRQSVLVPYEAPQVSGSPAPSRTYQLGRIGSLDVWILLSLCIIQRQKTSLNFTKYHNILFQWDDLGAKFQYKPSIFPIHFSKTIIFREGHHRKHICVQRCCEWSQACPNKHKSENSSCLWLHPKKLMSNAGGAQYQFSHLRVRCNIALWWWIYHFRGRSTLSSEGLRNKKTTSRNNNIRSQCKMICKINKRNTEEFYLPIEVLSRGIERALIPISLIKKLVVD